MHVDTQRITTDALKIGMHVAGIDRPWAETPFPIQGFRISNHQQLEILQQTCKWVEVEHHKPQRLNATQKTQASTKIGYSQNASKSRTLEKLLKPIRAEQAYQPSQGFAEESRQARKICKRVEERCKTAFMGLSGHGKLRLPQLHAASSELVASIIRNPDAFVYVARMERGQQSIINYAIRVATWAALFARHLNISQAVLTEITLAGLLCKIGYVTLPRDLFSVQGSPSPQEREMLKISLLSGIKLLRNTKNLPKPLMQGVSHHLERYDGSGFPHGLSASEIPLAAQIVGITAYYEEMVSLDFCDAPLASADAIRKIYQQRNLLFADYLVEAFIQAIGLYPTGSKVKLSDNREAFVVEQHPQSRLQPKIMLIGQSSQWRLFSKPKILDLSAQSRSKQPVRIIASLPVSQNQQVAESV